ncbi:MAG: mechanosensitive ion channel family protein [Micromonosporaceae bacterium]|nr:mechanosensitive ion channel family protein [Micromonosporaceae bacterium]
MRYESTVLITEVPSPTPSLAVPAAPAPTPTGPACLQGSELCQWVYDQTHNALLASGSYYFLIKPFRILMIILAALLLRWIVHRTVNRLVRHTAEATVPALLRPLRERLPTSLQEATTLFPERRRQRAEAIGSVLRSTATAVIFSIAFLLILSELGVDLAPLLASAGIVGVALGFGAQSLVKDLLAGLFMLLEDQYGVGDIVDVGEASGVVEAVGLRTTTLRDVNGALWYIRNGEIVRVGNRSQGWALIVVDIPIGFADVEQANTVLRGAATEMAEDDEWSDEILEGPDVLGVEKITIDGAVLRTTVKTNSDAQWRVGRELRRRLSEAVAAAGIESAMPAGRLYVRQPGPRGAAGAAGPPTPGPPTPGPQTSGPTTSGPAASGEGGPAK